jgi:hypothetical protein
VNDSREFEAKRAAAVRALEVTLDPEVLRHWRRRRQWTADAEKNPGALLAAAMHALTIGDPAYAADVAELIAAHLGMDPRVLPKHRLPIAHFDYIVLTSSGERKTDD